MIIVGVDPAFRKGGFWGAMLDLQTRQVKPIRFIDVFDFYEFIKALPDKKDVFCAIENSNLQNVTFTRGSARNAMTAARVSRNVGANQAVSELTFSAAQIHLGSGNVLAFSPKQKGVKIENSKIFEAYLITNNITLNWDGSKLCQDARDAIKIAVLSIPHAILLKNGAKC